MKDTDKMIMLAMLESLFNGSLIDVNVYEKARADVEKL